MMPNCPVSPSCMPTGAFIKTLPAASGTGSIPVKVVESDIGHAEAWDRDIQEPWIAGTYFYADEVFAALLTQQLDKYR